MIFDHGFQLREAESIENMHRKSRFFGSNSNEEKYDGSKIARSLL